MHLECLERRTTKDVSSRRVMRLVPSLYYRRITREEQQIFAPFVHTDNASPELRGVGKIVAILDRSSARKSMHENS